MRVLSLAIFLWTFNLTSQCPSINSSKGVYGFNQETKLHAPPIKAYKIVATVGRKFFFQKKDIPKLVGYELKFEEHPSAFAICAEDSDDYKKSKKLVGKTSSGYIWLQNDWLINKWSKDKFKLYPEVMFLIGHEVIHIIHRKDINFQKQVEKRDDGKFVFKKDQDGNYLGFFADIPKKLKDHAEELHADYGGGMVLYDAVLAIHDSWVMGSDDEAIKQAHKNRYDEIIAQVETFIRTELAPVNSSSHGTANERVEYFLKGVDDRRDFINKINDPVLRKKRMRNPDTELIDLLQFSGKELRIRYKKS